MKYILLAAWAAVSVAHAQTAWKLASGYSAETFQTENLMRFATDVAEASGQKLTIQVVPNGGLFKLPEIRQAVEQGRVQAGEVIMTGMVEAVPSAGADAIPFVVGSYKDAQRLWRFQRPVLERELALRGLRILYAVPWPPQGLYANRPMKTVTDFNGLRMRTYNQTTGRIAEMLGTKAVDLPMADVGKAIEDGRIDTMITSAVTGVDNQVWGGIKYYYDIRAWYPKNLVFVNAKSFDALPPAMQALVNKAATAAEQRGWNRSEAAAQQAMQTLQHHGIKLDRLPYELEIEFRRMGERFSREWVRTVGQQASAIFVPYYFD